MKRVLPLALLLVLATALPAQASGSTRYLPCANNAQHATVVTSGTSHYYSDTTNPNGNFADTVYTTTHLAVTNPCSQWVEVFFDLNIESASTCSCGFIDVAPGAHVNWYAKQIKAIFNGLDHSKGGLTSGLQGTPSCIFDMPQDEWGVLAYSSTRHEGAPYCPDRS